MTEVILFYVILMTFVIVYIVTGWKYRKLKNEQKENNVFWTDLQYSKQEAEQPKAVFTEPIPEIPEIRPERSIKV